MRYLARSRGVPDHWYPADLRKRAEIEKYLDAHHFGLRACCGAYVSRKFFGVEQLTEEMIQKYLDKQQEEYGKLEKMLENQDYLCGSEISIADLSAAMEIETMIIAGGIPAAFPKTDAWRIRVLDGNPECAKILEPFRAFAASKMGK